MLNVDLAKIQKVNLDDKSLCDNCVATILAIAALHVKSNDKKNLWTMIEQKAMAWLLKILPNENINQIIKNTESLIK